MPHEAKSRPIDPRGSAGAADRVGRILQVVRSRLGMDVAFVSQFVGDERVFRHVDAAGEAPIRAGDSGPLSESYCQQVVDGRLPALIPDTSAVPAAMAMPVTTSLPVGAHLSVPIRLRDGRLYGTFCCFNYRPDRSLNARDLNIMQAFADLATDDIEQELQAREQREAAIARIKAVIEQEQLSVVYQPIYRLESGRVAGLECLTRFSALPSRGPEAWFAEAAEVGLTTQLELAVMRVALAPLQPLPPDMYVALNISPATILSGEMEKVLGTMPPVRIVLEVTEHAAVRDYDALIHALAPLRRRGLRLAVDDAGAGYASLRHILNLRPDLIKLDVSLVRGIDGDPARRALAAALIAFARTTGSHIVAEGVERAAELEALRALKVEKAQGFYLGRPVPFADIPRVLRTRVGSEHADAKARPSGDRGRYPKRIRGAKRHQFG